MQAVTVPHIGESINEVTIARWLKQEGDYVQQDEVIAEIESEKASFEIRAEVAGRLHILAEDGADVQVGAAIAEIDTDAAPLQQAADAVEPKRETVAASVKEQPAADDRASDVKPKPSTHQPSGESLEVKVPSVGESIQQVTLARWLKPDGALVQLDEVIAELESEKASFEIRAEASGWLHHQAKEGDDIPIGAIIAIIEPSVEGASAAAQPETQSAPEPASSDQPPITVETPASPATLRATPVAAAMMADQHLSPAEVRGSGPSGKIRKEDVRAALQRPGITIEKPAQPSDKSPAQPAAQPASTGTQAFSRNERRERMSNLRRTISRRLVEAKNTTAMLTTFNEVDMSAIMQIRNQYKEAFKEKHGVSLGFMSFFTKACCYALQEWPAVNAYIDGDEIIYHDYCDISIAVSTPRGLVVPVIRNAESLSMAEIERKVLELATKAREGKLSLEEMTGGTFTITNGGVFGSLMSTPLLNLPQSAILGMHKIQERPVVINGQIVARPMMYVALSYDHRIIDGRESVSFLVRVKELLENPQQLLSGRDPVKTLLEL
ncbi:2-oxoglutarate dehydrogenase complex dihydrolipoyllysine-residue succinyltransferase [Thermoflavifilum thermophilum]|uniref:Dihydrolipoyllysine-residue succinyltransferase component of 2-oxoglutarate dehydrogenase complex n=1 Tax=Thermoflavifilum thermophilum TaxID=1393122 RepID=A0A1I7NGN0_9BACT|nr:2-oxoglutarate dehydrogenase complex dihydrolipoyllysine-residue succinyltransferase [Thermoflavifilum thermophilum]SFV33820.1 2-oxoglutarate dehydrogenase E2 component [Thermoflavifilum thermophilum]